MQRLIAIKSLSAFHGIGIFDVTEDDDDVKVLVADIYEGEMKSKPRYCKVRHASNGASYFRHNNQREYLDDYMRTNNR